MPDGTTTDATDTPPPREGELVGGRYRVRGPLGQGRVAWVYRAEDTQAGGREVALKFLRAELAGDAEVLARFEREARTMASLEHASIVRGLDAGRDAAGGAWMAMELAPGESLRARLDREGALETGAAVDVAQQVGAALDHAHARGVIHRDLNPTNVFVAGDGARPRAWVLDFGMARVAPAGAGGVGLTRRGLALGTPAYMSSEQAVGLPVDARADQYALGVILYEMLSGRCPYAAATSLESVQLHLRASAPPLPSLAPGVPTALVRVVERMMSRAASDRFPDVRAALDAMRATMPAGWADAHPVALEPRAGATPAAPQPTATAPAPVAKRSARAVALVAVAVALVLVCALVALLARP